MEIYRHGDILITPVKAAPEYVSPQDDLIIARGEITGHAHRVVAEQHAELLTSGYRDMKGKTGFIH